MNKTVRTLVAIGEWGSAAVLRRNALVYMRTWRTGMVPPLLEPVIFFLAFGMGLGSYVGHLTYNGGEVDYPAYVAPGMLAYTAFVASFYEALYSSYVRMHYQKTWDGMLASQLELQHVVWGEVLWAGFRGALNSTIVALVLVVFDAIHWVQIETAPLLLVPVLSLIGGVAFAAFATVFTAVVPSIDHINFPVFLIGVPISLTSNTYFPLAPESPILQALINLNPVYHLAEAYRGLLLGGPFEEHVLLLLATSASVLVLFGLAAQRLMRRRVLGE